MQTNYEERELQRNLETTTERSVRQNNKMQHSKKNMQNMCRYILNSQETRREMQNDYKETQTSYKEIKTRKKLKTTFTKCCKTTKRRHEGANKCTTTNKDIITLRERHNSHKKNKTEKMIKRNAVTTNTQIDANETKLQRHTKDNMKMQNKCT